MQEMWRPTVFYLIEDGNWIKLERLGECKKCGECCGGKRIGYRCQVGLTTREVLNEEEEEGDWSNYEGWSAFYAQGVWWYFLVTDISEEDGKICEGLDVDKTCKDWYDEKDFKPICRYWPWNPKDLEQFPECGFSFRRVVEKEDEMD